MNSRVCVFLYMHSLEMRATIYLRIYISRHTVWVTGRSLILIDLDEVLRNHVGIVARLKETVILLVMVLVDVVEGVLGLVPQ